MKSVGLQGCSTSDTINFDQIWHPQCSSSARGNDLSNDTQIKGFESIEPDICTKMPRNLSNVPRANGYRYSMSRIARIDNAFSGILEQEVSIVESQPLQQKDKKRRKRKSEKKSAIKDQKA